MCVCVYMHIKCERERADVYKRQTEIEGTYCTVRSVPVQRTLIQ